MRRDEMAALTAFVVVAEEQNFTRAASRLGISQSALSQIIRRLEDGLGLRLLTRTTRSVALTEAGQRILDTLGPALKDLDDRIAALSEETSSASGTIRVTSVEHASRNYLLPALKELFREHPKISVEVIDDYALSNIVTEKFDAGIRLGHQIDQDMIAVPISPPVDMLVVGSPVYLNANPAPSVPADLLKHQCINLWLPTTGNHYEWRFSQQGHATSVKVQGPFTSNKIDQILQATVDGMGLAYLPVDFCEAAVTDGQLVPVLEDWAQPLPAYHLYYPHRRNASRAFRLFVEQVRYRAGGRAA